MQRKSFIQHLTALGAFSFLPAKACTHYQKIYLLQCFVAGFRYYKGMELLTEMQQGDLLELVREPDNAFDNSAIALHWNQHKIGFFPATDNQVLSRLLDAQALELSAEITHLNKQTQPWENLAIAIHFLKQIPIGTMPANMQYLTVLQSPEYTTYKHTNNTLTRIANNPATIEVDDWYEFLEKHIKNDIIYSIIHNSNVIPNYLYGEDTGATFLINKKRLPGTSIWQQIITTAEDTLGTLDELFTEDGYLVANTRDISALIPQLESIVDVTDKLGRHFIELRFA